MDLPGPEGSDPEHSTGARAHMLRAVVQQEQDRTFRFSRPSTPQGCAGGGVSGRDSALAVSDANRVGASR
jgi:hypothetical protein